MGLVFAAWGKTRVSPDVEKPMHTFWHVLSYHGNTLIFMLAGAVVALVGALRGTTSTVIAAEQALHTYICSLVPCYRDLHLVAPPPLTLFPGRS